MLAQLILRLETSSGGSLKLELSRIVVHLGDMNER
jgi:hypothetical protein